MRATRLLVFLAVAGAAYAAAVFDPRPSGEGVATSSLSLPAAFDREPLPAGYDGVELDGMPFVAAELHGKVVLLDFWAVWCAPCITAVPKLNGLQAEFGGDEFEVIGYAVYSGPGEDVASFAQQHGIEYRVVVGNNDLTFDYGVIGYPSYFLIDQEGRKVRKYVGALPDLQERIGADVRLLLGNVP